MPARARPVYVNVIQQQDYIQRLRSKLKMRRVCNSYERKKIRRLIIRLTGKLDEFCAARVAAISDETKERRRKLQGRDPQYQIGRPPTCR